MTAPGCGRRASSGVSASSRCGSNASAQSVTVTVFPASSDREVTPASVMPHGTIAENAHQAVVA